MLAWSDLQAGAPPFPAQNAREGRRLECARCQGFNSIQGGQMSSGPQAAQR